MKRLMSRQKVRLFELLEENYYMLSGSANRGHREKTAKWEEIKETLNGLGPSKTTEKWRRVWTDIRKTLKNKCSLRRTYETNGANIPDELIFSESDLWVIRICGMDAFEKPAKVIKQEREDANELEDYYGPPTLSIPVRKPTRSSERVGNRKPPRKKAKIDKIVNEIVDESNPNYVCPLLVFSDDKATQCTEIAPSIGPSSKKPKKSLGNQQSLENPPEAEDNKDKLKQLVYLQRRQLAVTRQIHERQKCHNADQRQFNAKVTNLLEEILQQLKSNQTKK